MTEEMTQDEYWAEMAKLGIKRSDPDAEEISAIDWDAVIEEDKRLRRQQRVEARKAEILAAWMELVKELQEQRPYVPDPVAEYDYGNLRPNPHPGKQDRRADWAFVNQKMRLFVEIEGGVRTGGAHARQGGIIRDMDKYNEAQLYGFDVLRVLPEWIVEGTEALDLLLRYFTPDWGTARRTRPEPALKNQEEDSSKS